MFACIKILVRTDSEVNSVYLRLENQEKKERKEKNKINN